MMSSTEKVMRYSIFPALLILSACQMPVKPNRDLSTSKPGISVDLASQSEDKKVAAPEATAPVIDEEHAVEPAVIQASPNKQTGDVVFSRLSNNFSGPICRDSATVNQWKKRYAGNPKAFSNHLAKILPLLDYVSVEVERRDLPAEFALIPIIESWYQPHAIGSGGPSGLWQMIGSTAKNHGIKIHAGYDGRFSVVDSTDAALSYLGTLQGMFKDWQRAVMGYNAGEFRVLRAIRVSGSHAEGQDHWPNGLSPITYAYIGKIQALSCLISQPEKNNLSLPSQTEFTPLAAVPVDENLRSLDSIAKRYELDIDNLRMNNPAYKNGIISAHAPRRVLMPVHLATIELANIGSNPAFRIEKQSVAAGDLPAVIETHGGKHEVKSGDTLWSVAKRYGLSMPSLRKLNGLGPKAILRIGQNLKLSP